MSLLLSFQQVISAESCKAVIENQVDVNEVLAQIQNEQDQVELMMKHQSKVIFGLAYYVAQERLSQLNKKNIQVATYVTNMGSAHLRMAEISAVLVPLLDSMLTEKEQSNVITKLAKKLATTQESIKANLEFLALNVNKVEFAEEIIRGFPDLIKLNESRSDWLQVANGYFQAPIVLRWSEWWTVRTMFPAVSLVWLGDMGEMGNLAIVASVVFPVIEYIFSSGFDRPHQWTVINTFWPRIDRFLYNRNWVGLRKLFSSGNARLRTNLSQLISPSAINARVVQLTTQLIQTKQYSPNEQVNQFASDVDSLLAALIEEFKLLGEDLKFPLDAEDGSPDQRIPKDQLNNFTVRILELQKINGKMTDLIFLRKQNEINDYYKQINIALIQARLDQNFSPQIEGILQGLKEAMDSHRKNMEQLQGISVKLAFMAQIFAEQQNGRVYSLRGQNLPVSSSDLYLLANICLSVADTYKMEVNSASVALGLIDSIIQHFRARDAAFNDLYNGVEAIVGMKVLSSQIVRDQSGNPK